MNVTFIAKASLCASLAFLKTIFYKSKSLIHQKHVSCPNVKTRENNQVANPQSF